MIETKKGERKREPERMWEVVVVGVVMTVVDGLCGGGKERM